MSALCTRGRTSRPRLNAAFHPERRPRTDKVSCRRCQLAMKRFQWNIAHSHMRRYKYRTLVSGGANRVATFKSSPLTLLLFQLARIIAGKDTSQTCMNSRNDKALVHLQFKYQNTQKTVTKSTFNAWLFCAFLEKHSCCRHHHAPHHIKAPCHTGSMPASNRFCQSTPMNHCITKIQYHRLQPADKSAVFVTS